MWLLFSHGFDLWFIVEVALAIVSWGTFIATSVRLITKPNEGSESTPRWDENKRLEQRSEVWANRLSTDQSVYLVRSIAYPQSCITRISETVSFSGTSLEIDTNTTFELPSSLSERDVILPVLLQARGVVVHGLQVSDQAQMRLSTVARNDTEAILLFMAKRLITTFLGNDLNREKYQLNLVRRAKRILRSSDKGFAYKQYQEFSKRTKKIKDAHRLKKREWSLLEGFMLRISEYYPILVYARQVTSLAWTPSSGLQHWNPGSVQPPYVRICTRRREQMPFVPEEKTSDFVRNLVRMLRMVPRAIGVHEPVLRYNLLNADRCASYHLEIKSPPGMVVANTSIPRRTGGPPNRSRRIGVPRLGGTSVAHFYAQDARNLTGHRALTTFREKAPGSIGEALISSGIIFVMLLSIVIGGGAIRGQLMEILAPIIFAGVGAGSIWQGVILTRDPFGGRLLARVSSIVTMVLAVWAIVEGATEQGARLSFLHRPDWNIVGWELLLSLAGLNLMVILAAWGADVIVDMWFGKSREPTSREPVPDR